MCTVWQNVTMNSCQFRLCCCHSVKMSQKLRKSEGNVEISAVHFISYRQVFVSVCHKMLLLTPFTYVKNSIVSEIQ